MDWIQVAQKSDQWRDLVDTAIYIRVELQLENLFTSNIFNGLAAIARSDRLQLLPGHSILLDTSGYSPTIRKAAN